MYLTKRSRRWCIGFSVAGLLMTGLLLLSVNARSPRDRVPVWAAFVTGGIFYIPAGIPLVLFYMSAASRRVAHRDVLRADLSLSGIAEIEGVQVVSLPFPDAVTPPTFFALSFFLQNCHTTPREISIQMLGSTFPWRDAHDRHTLTLAGGETGVFNVLAFLGTRSVPGEHPVRFRIRARRGPAGIGMRMIEADVVGRTMPRGRGEVIVSVGAPATASEDARYMGLEAFAGYRVLFKPGMDAPDEDALAFMRVNG